MRQLLFFLVLLASFLGAQEGPNLTAPPSQRPVQVECGIFLLDLVSIIDKEETFVADVNFSFAWYDSRLGYTPQGKDDIKVFLDIGAEDQLKKMWWPQVEFLNAGKIENVDRSLFIYPNGKVEYHIGFTGSFRSHLDLTQFPFDKQTLQIKVDSFLWNKNIVEFVPSAEFASFQNLGADIHNDEKIIDTSVSMELNKGVKLTQFGGSDEFSTIVASITIARKPGFFLYQLFVPLFLIMGISCTVFFASRSDYIEVVALSLTSFLVFLAAKFTLNQDLPRVGYMTVIDKAFLVAYLSLGASVVLCTLREVYNNKGKPWADKILSYASWMVPLAFILAIFWIFLR